MIDDGVYQQSLFWLDHLGASFAEHKTNTLHLWSTNRSGNSRTVIIPRTNICPNLAQVSSTFSRSGLFAEQLLVHSDHRCVNRSLLQIAMKKCWVMVSAHHTPSCFYPYITHVMNFTRLPPFSGKCKTWTLDSGLDSWTGLWTEIWTRFWTDAQFNDDHFQQ